jgi:nitrilase
MGDSYPVVKVAAVQAASVFLDREGSTEKACRLIVEAGRHGARLIAFPEGFIPAHPVWYHHHAATGPAAHNLALELFRNSIEIPGAETEVLCAAARSANAYVVIGVCERQQNSMGTLFNSQLYIGPDGRIIRKHQKIMPTGGERLVHMGGAAHTFGAFPTEFGPMSGLICGENSNPLAVFALTAEGTRIHAMSWPCYLGSRGGSLHRRVVTDSQAFAQMSKSFVVSACGVIDEDLVAKLGISADEAARLREPGRCGGSLIVAPDSSVIAGPLGMEEAILYGECDLEMCASMKLRHDFAGHYNRPDIFRLEVNRVSPQIYTVHEASRQAALPADAQRASGIESTPALPATDCAPASPTPLGAERSHVEPRIGAAGESRAGDDRASTGQRPLAG